jgi:hypothetical protein
VGQCIPIGHWRAFNVWDIVFPFRHKGLNLSCTKIWSSFKATLSYLSHNKLTQRYLLLLGCVLSGHCSLWHVQQLFLTPHNSHNENNSENNNKNWHGVILGNNGWHDYFHTDAHVQIQLHIDANLDFFGVFLIGTLLTAVVIETNRYVR